jgi:hypothetical protein
MPAALPTPSSLSADAANQPAPKGAPVTPQNTQVAVDTTGASVQPTTQRIIPIGAFPAGSIEARLQQAAQAADAMETAYGSYTAHPTIHDKFPTVVKDLDGKWYELKCTRCGNNTTARGGKFIKGTMGFFNHLLKSHDLTSGRRLSIHAYDKHVMSNVDKREVSAAELANMSQDPNAILKSYTPSGVKLGPHKLAANKVQKNSNKSSGSNAELRRRFSLAYVGRPGSDRVLRPPR